MRERLTVVGLALFVALDLLLVALAVRHVQRPPDTSDRSSTTIAPSSPATRSPSSPAAASTRSSPTISSSPDTVGGPSTAFLAVADDRTLLRASRGSCERQEPAVVAISTDDGAEFAASDVPELVEVLGLRASSAQDLAVIGLGSRCRVARFSTSDGGRSWSRSGGAGATWSLGAATGTIDSPNGEVTPPCTPQAVSTVNETLVRLLCDNGNVLGTDDNGATWITLGTLDGAVDLGFATAGEGVALAKQKRCPAAVLRSVDGGGSWTRLGCVPGTRPLAIGAQGSVVAAQVGDRLYLSNDGGKSWPGPAGH